LKKISSKLPALMIGATFAVLVYFEHRRSLRRTTEPKLRRDLRNLGIAAVGGLVMQMAENPAVLPLARLTERRKIGLTHWLRLPPFLGMLAGILLMDYTLYLWHILTHKVPFLWRFHLVHHADLDLDASTALRFHFGEMLLSVPCRAAQVLLIGVSPGAYLIWQNALFLSILFHHSNVRLPMWAERMLSRVIVTPRLHGIHHDAVMEHANSNWSSGLSVWDRLHGTLESGVPQSDITIGVPAYRHPADVTLVRSLELPFREQRDAWVQPD